MKVKYEGRFLGMHKSRTIMAHNKLTYDKPSDKGKEQTKKQRIKEKE
jgi:hypothetical protein